MNILLKEDAFYLTIFVGATLVNSVSVSGVWFCNASSVCRVAHHPESSPVTKCLAFFTLLTPTSLPFQNHDTVSVSQFVCFLCSLVVFCCIFHVSVKSYGFCPFASDLFHLAWYSQDSSSVVENGNVSSFLWLSNIPVHVCATSSISSLPLKDT